MYVCLCQGITDRQIRAAVDGGASSLREVRECLGVAAQCGKCGVMAKEIIRNRLNETSARQADDLFYAVA